jgi:hypothetical protein
LENRGEHLANAVPDNAKEMMPGEQLHTGIIIGTEDIYSTSVISENSAGYN